MNPNVSEQIIRLIYETGRPLKIGDMGTIKAERKTLYNKCLELLRKGQLERLPDDTWKLRDGVIPETLHTGEVKTNGQAEKPAPEGDAAGSGIPLTQQAMFMQHLTAIGVTPKEAVPTITQIFFSGNIESLHWLNQVLTREAQGYVTPHQRGLMISWWAHTRGLSDKQGDFPLMDNGTPEATGANIIDQTGMGWKVGKDKAGDWVPVPGGPMTYQLALAAAERRAAIEAMKVGEEPEETAEGGDGKPAPKGKRAESLQDYFMKKVVDAFVEGRAGGDEESPALKALQEQLSQATQVIQQMKDNQDREWRERIETTLTAIASRDPWSDPAEVARARQLLGIPSTTVTDSSPAVQLLKDSTDKLDKNVGRLVGIVERVALHSEEFRPEEKRSPQEKEAKADALLNQATQRDKSKALRQRAFGV